MTMDLQNVLTILGMIATIMVCYAVTRTEVAHLKVEVIELKNDIKDVKDNSVTREVMELKMGKIEGKLDTVISLMTQITKPYNNKQ